LEGKPGKLYQAIRWSEKVIALSRVRAFLATSSLKNKIVFRNVFFSFFIKGINIVVSFLTIPLVLSFLSTTQYGIWLTLTAVLTWFSVFDLGLGNGLRNHLTRSLSKDAIVESRIYVSTTYAALLGIFGTLAVLFLFIHSYVNWNSVFNAPSYNREDLSSAVFYAISFLFLQFVLRLINTILLAYQRSAMADLSNAIIQVAILVGLYTLKLKHYNSLTAVAVVYSAIPVIVFIVFSIFLFNTSYKEIRPSYSFVRFEHAKGLLSIGLNFFVIQIAALVIYASDNFIISQFFSPSDVTTYNIAFKYFSIANVMLSIILAPFWSMTTKAYAENDWDWIKKTMNKLIKIWVGLACILLIQLLVSNIFYDIWTNSNVAVPISMSIVLCLYYLIFTWGSIFGNFLNGIGKIKMQLYIATASMIINIPIAIMFIKIFKFGVLSVPLSAIMVTLLVSTVSYVQYKKLIQNRAVGIWNK
jgi:O-antigen/teichoic acid export membrane protein